MLRMSNWENDAESVDEELTSFLSGVGAASAPVPETVACEESQDELVLKELISFLSGGGSSAAGTTQPPRLIRIKKRSSVYGIQSSKV